MIGSSEVLEPLLPRLRCLRGVSDGSLLRPSDVPLESVLLDLCDECGVAARTGPAGGTAAGGGGVAETLRRLPRPSGAAAGALAAHTATLMLLSAATLFTLVRPETLRALVPLARQTLEVLRAEVTRTEVRVTAGSGHFSARATKAAAASALRFVAAMAAAMFAVAAYAVVVSDVVTVCKDVRGALTRRVARVFQLECAPSLKRDAERFAEHAAAALGLAAPPGARGAPERLAAAAASGGPPASESSEASFRMCQAQGRAAAANLALPAALAAIGSAALWAVAGVSSGAPRPLAVVGLADPRVLRARTALFGRDPGVPLLLLLHFLPVAAHWVALERLTFLQNTRRAPADALEKWGGYAAMADAAARAVNSRTLAAWETCIVRPYTEAAASLPRAVASVPRALPAAAPAAAPPSPPTPLRR